MQGSIPVAVLTSEIMLRSVPYRQNLRIIRIEVSSEKECARFWPTHTSLLCFFLQTFQRQYHQVRAHLLNEPLVLCCFGSCNYSTRIRLVPQSAHLSKQQHNKQPRANDNTTVCLLIQYT